MAKNAKKPEKSQKAEKTGRKSRISRDRVDEAPVINQSMEKIAQRIRIAKIVALVLLFLYVFLMLNIFKDRITLENLQYLTRGLEPDRLGNREASKVLSYLADKDTVIVPFKGGLAMQNKDGLRLIDKSGDQTYVERDVRENAVLASSDKYLLAYDRVSGAYSIYNAFSRVKSEKLSQRISDHWITNSGAFALCLAPSGELCEFRVYSEQLSIKMSVRRNGYPACVSMNPDGTEAMAVYYSYTVGGEYRTNIEFYDTKSGDLKRSTVYSGALVLDGAESEDGGAWLLTTDGIVRVCAECKAKTVCSFAENGQRLLQYAMSAEGVLIVTSIGNEKNAVTCALYGADGACLQNRTFYGTVSAVNGSGGYFTILGSDGIHVLHGDQSCEPEMPDVEVIGLLSDQNAFYICGYTRSFCTLFSELPFDGGKGDS